jgi:outer membrane protein insertion porin family
MVGAGFSSAEKVSLSGSISQANLFGSGKTVSVGVNTSKINTVYSFSYTDPYYTVDGVSAGFDVYHRNVNTSSLSIAKYQTKSTGGGLRLGLPISDEDYVTAGLAVDTTALTVDSTSPLRYQQYVAQNGDSFSSLIASTAWSRNTIDSRIYPTSGTIARVGGELSIPPGSLTYYRMSAQHQHYWSLSKTFTLYTNAEISKADGYRGKELPFFKNYYAGGVGSVRGYETSTLGPIDPTSLDRIGGNRRIIGNMELLFPMPGSGLDKSVRLGAFLDGGQVWSADQKISLNDMRFSTGISLTWSSPMGPLKFSIAQPLNSKPDDKLQRLQFNMGSVF